eukprot:CAMPEP_0178413676 /NCGR_PEP_ID=MMETSP0689_2-20121128/22650_1 /TAXON_ID=160604 /ORGANISM="Amphidinium massartii, Strain CS-259" /LENGTH=415 /DNA_ID=CAMNT_0020034955 /DNA_START=80 /DNA_END=1324 /DNA_ORIENTATION=-
MRWWAISALCISTFLMGRNSDMLFPLARTPGVTPVMTIETFSEVYSPVETTVQSVAAAMGFAPSSGGGELGSRDGGSQCKAVDECGWNFKRYIPSSLEKQWWDVVDEVGGVGVDICKSMRQDRFWPLFMIYITTCSRKDLIVSDKTHPPCDCEASFGKRDYNPDVFSRFEYENSCTGEIRYSFIEPLAGVLRHPALCQPRGGETEQNSNKTFNYLKFKPRKDWMVVDQWDLLNRHGSAKSRYLYFDAGASIWDAGPGGASQSWFDALYRSKCAVFDGYWLWEAQPFPGKVLDMIPGSVLPKYHWFNVPASQNASDKFSPLYHIKAVATPEDHVVVKIDIDTAHVEDAIIAGILADKTLQGLIDEIYYEHHVNVLPMRTAWGKNNPIHGYNKEIGQRESIGIFKKLREAGIRAHSW